MIESQNKLPPNKDLWNAIENKAYVYSQNKVIGEHGSALAEIEYKRCLSYFENTFPNKPQLNELMPLAMDRFLKIEKKENSIKSQLESIARKLVSDFFNFPEENFSNTSINKNFVLKKDTNSPQKKVDEEKLKPHVNKRIILNSLVHGGAINCWKAIHLLAKEQLDDIDAELSQLYSEYTALISMLFWQNPPPPELSLQHKKKMLSSPGVKQGQNQVEFDGDEPNISAQASCFPVLIHELVKGVLDLVILHGLDENLSKEEQQYIMFKADDHFDEYWYYLLGPGLWIILMEKEEPDSDMIPELIQALAKKKYNSIVKYFLPNLEHANNKTSTSNKT